MFPRPLPRPRPRRALCIAFWRALCRIGGGAAGLGFRFAAALARRFWQGRGMVEQERMAEGAMQSSVRAE